MIGDYDNLKEPTVITKGWDYICYTSNKHLKSKHWDVHHQGTQEKDFIGGDTGSKIDIIEYITINSISDNIVFGDLTVIKDITRCRIKYLVNLLIKRME